MVAVLVGAMLFPLATPASSQPPAEPEVIAMKTEYGLTAPPVVPEGGDPVTPDPAVVVEPAPTDDLVPADLENGVPDTTLGPGVQATIPRFPNDNTLGYTTKTSKLDQWRNEQQNIDFEIDMGPLANKGHYYKRDNGYWLQMAFAMVGYFVIDGDGRFDDYRTTDTPPGDEPCHAEDFKLFDLEVNGVPIHTAMGTNDRPCDTESSRLFDIVPMTKGEASNQYRIETWIVKPGKNTVTIKLYDTGFTHPSAAKASDGWYMYLDAAMMELVAPPMFIAHGWDGTPPPTAHKVGIDDWQKKLGTDLQQKAIDHFGQNPWQWGKPAGMWLFGYDGKADFRLSAKQLKTAVWQVANQVGYCFNCDPNLQGFWYLGFSMGGLTGRWMIQNEQMLQNLGKYVSVGTPHKGSTWADIYTFTLDKVNAPYRDVNGDRIREWFGWKPWWQDNVQARVYDNNWFEWLALPPHWEGNGALRDYRADMELKAHDNPVLSGMNGGAGAMASKAFAVTGTGGNAVRDVGALIGGRLHPALSAIALLPDSDLIVSVDSAKLGGLFKSENCFAVHIEGVPGVPFYFNEDSCIKPVFEFLMGFRDPGKVSDPASIREEPGFEAPDGGSSGPALSETPDGVLQVPFGQAASVEVELNPDSVTGEAEAEVEVRVEGTPSALFQAMWPMDPAFAEMTLTSPSGQEFTQANADLHGATFSVRTYFGLSRTQFAVGDPEPGLWTVTLRATEDTPEWGMGAVVVGGVVGTLDLQAEAPPRAEPGGTVLVTARLTAPVDSVTITAHAVPTDVDLAFSDEGQGGDAVAGDGVYTAAYEPGNDLVGEHIIDITAEGMVGGVAFSRSARVGLVNQGTVDLEVRAMTITPDHLWWGESAEAVATVANTGTGTAHGVRAVWGDDADTSRRQALDLNQAVGDIAPGASAEVRMMWTPTPGTKVLRLQVYADDIEEDLSDNAGSAGAEVLPTPRTAATLTGTEGLEGWYTSAVKVKLAPFDKSPAPYLETRYRLDAGTWQVYSVPFSVAADGTHDLEFRSIDPQGREENLRTASFAIDSKPPDLRIERPRARALHTMSLVLPMEQLTMPVVLGPVEVHLRNSDLTSGVARLDVRIDDIPATVIPDPTNLQVWVWDSSTTSLGRHTLHVNATDHAGLVTYMVQQVYVSVSRAVQVDDDTEDTMDRIRPPLAGV